MENLRPVTVVGLLHVFGSGQTDVPRVPGDGEFGPDIGSPGKDSPCGCSAALSDTLCFLSEGNQALSVSVSRASAQGDESNSLEIIKCDNPRGEAIHKPAGRNLLPQ